MEMRRLWSQNRNGSGYAAFLTASTKIFHLTHPRTVSHGRAAEIRSYNPILSIAAQNPEGAVPQVFYHWECRNSFARKIDLDSLLSSEHSLAGLPRNKPSERQTGNGPH